MAADLTCDGSGNIAVLDIVDTINRNRKQEEGHDVKNIKNYGRQKAGFNLDSATKSGIYGGGGTFAHGPLNSGFGIFFVLVNSDIITQTYHDYQSNKMWTRYKHGSKWGSWASVLTGTWNGTTLNITV